MKKIKVSVLGATGMVGQNYLRLLENHPWFEVVDVAASSRTAGKTYQSAVSDRWYMKDEMPSDVRQLVIRNVEDVGSVPDTVQCIFSAIDLGDKSDTRDLEFQYAQAGYPVISNSSANRWTEDVPMIIPEINSDHTDVISIQQANRNLPKTGFVVVKPNCSIQSYLVNLHAIIQAGFPMKRVMVTTLQALSGAGYKGLTSEEYKDNVVPFIQGEEEKTENEPLKILGKVTDSGISQYQDIQFSATCTRVPVTDGHTAVVHVDFKSEVPTPEQIKKIWSEFRSAPQSWNLPFAPENPILYSEDESRPQAKPDRDNEKGMAVTAGRLTRDKFFDIKFISLSHNTIRGAAGGAILVGELLVKKGFIANV